MPIKSTSENPESKFWPIPGPNVMSNKSLVLTLLVSAAFAFLFVHGIYAGLGGNPENRMAFALFVSGLPFLVTLLFLRLTKLIMPWYAVATLYLLIFFLVVIIQKFGRMIPVYY